LIPYERIADNVYSFQSENYAQVTAGVVAGPNWAVVIDTLAFPDETLQLRDFVEQELKIPVRYVVNTHYHADHAWGNAFFPGALVVSSRLCRELLIERGRPSFERARHENPSVFRQPKLVLPSFTFERGVLALRVGKKTLTLHALPGHSADGIGVLVEEDRVLFSGDVFMALPSLVDGDYDQMVMSLRKIQKMGLENIIQGHGDIVLRGEIDGMVHENLRYLREIHKAVNRAGKRRFSGDILEEIDVETAGKSRVILGGLAGELHRRNLTALFRQTFGRSPERSEE